MANCLIVSFEQFIQRFKRLFVVGMPEPMQVAKRSVGFDGTPAKVAVTVDYVPVFIRDATALSAYPASIAIFEKASVGKDDGVG